MAIAVNRHRFTVTEYHRMGEAGILGESVELIAGDIIVREPIGPYHAGTVNRLTWLWSSRLGERAVVQVQNPIELPEEHSEPQPDLALLRRRADFYATAHPLAADVLLLIEVADTTPVLDRRVKIPLYARAGIREVWLVDLAGDRVEVCRKPAREGYGEVLVIRGDASIAPEAFPDLGLTARDLLG